MKRLVWFCPALLLLAASLVSASAQNTDRNRIVGAWKLLALEQPGADGNVNTIKCCGMFVFTSDGHLSVQVMEPDSKSHTQPAGSQQYSQGGYEASYGSYVVDEKSHTFTFHVDGALVRTLIGKDLPRRYTFDGDRLIVQSTQPEEHWRVVWVRY
jgi:hypothetical protein